MLEETAVKSMEDDHQQPSPEEYVNHNVKVENAYNNLAYTPQQQADYLSLKIGRTNERACRSPACVWIGVAIAFVLGAALGILLGFFAIHRPVGQPLATLIPTEPPEDSSVATTFFTTTSPKSTTSTTPQPARNVTALPGQCAFSVTNAHLGMSSAETSLVFSQEYVDYPSNVSLDHYHGLFTPVSANRHTLYFYNLDVFTKSRTLNVTLRPDPDLSDPWYRDYYSWNIRHSGNADGEYSQIGRETIRGSQANIKIAAFYSNGYLQDSIRAFNGWSGFSLSTSIEQRAIFNMVRRSGQTELGKIGFHRALANAGDNLPVTDDKKPDEITNEYPVPFDGLYYFSYSFGTVPNEGAEVMLYVNEQPYSSLVSQANNRNGSTVVSRSQMLYLYQGNKVSIRLVSGAVHSSPDGEEVCLLGFWYRPQSGLYQAWSVHRTQPLTTNMTNLLPTPYNRVWVNAGRVWDEQTNTVQIRVPGVYYIQTNGCKTPGKPLYLHLRVNNRIMASAHMNDNVVQLNGPHSITRGLVVKLVRGDEVDVLIRGTSHSQINALTSFTGFLIYPTP